MAIERGYSAAMPWMRDLGDVRVVDAHTCGVERTFSHLVLASPDSKASILIVPRSGLEQATASLQPVRYGEFEVSEVTTPKHVVLRDRAAHAVGNHARLASGGARTG